MVLGKLPVPGRPTNLDYSRARAYCACSRCGWGWLGIFSLLCHFSLLSPSLWETARYRLKYCLTEPLSPKATNQLTMKSSVDLAQYRVSRAKDWVSVDCGTKPCWKSYFVLGNKHESCSPLLKRRTRKYI